MIQDVNRLRVARQQMERLIRAIDDLKANVLPKDPQLFAVMAEAPLDDLDRLRQEISRFVGQLRQTA